MRYMLLILCALLLCSGCAPTIITSPAIFGATHAAAATPAPDAAALSDAFLSAWREEQSIDVSPYLPENFFDAASPWQIFDATSDERLWLPAMAAAVSEQLETSIERARLAFSQAQATPVRIAWQAVEGPTWQLLYALLQGCANASEAGERIIAAMELKATAEPSGGELKLGIIMEPKPYREALRLQGGDEGSYRSRCFSYSYLYTVYGADAAEIEYVLPPAEGNLATGVCWPLSSHTRLRKTWFADRDDGKRKHTGTDIWAKADTDIYSCTGGVVTYVGDGSGTGFAVIVTDEYGYEYHYYHMIRLSDFLSVGDSVSAGEFIGNVGNTGNSDLDHLHLTIVAPDGKYINPYPYLEAVEPEKDA